MGRLDKDIETDVSLDDMDDDDLLLDDDFLDGIHPDVIRKSTRRRLEDMLEDRWLEQQLGDYNFDI